MTSKHETVIGVEGGATKTEWALVHVENGQHQIVQEGTLPAANFRLTAREGIIRVLQSLPRVVDRVGVFLAGCHDTDRDDLEALVRGVWPEASVAVGADRESGFAAAFGDGDGIAVIAGTGSAVTGRKDGRTEKAGGWGQLLGDRGSGFDIAVHGLRHCLRIYDVEGRTIPLTQSLILEVGLNTLEELVQWAQRADKLAIARLAHLVFEAAASEDSEINIILDVCARRLAEYAGAVAKRLDMDQPTVRLLGGVFTREPKYVELFRKNLAAYVPGAVVEVCRRSGATGAARLAASIPMRAEGGPSEDASSSPGEVPSQHRALARAATEQQNPRSEDLDRLSTGALVELFISEEPAVTAALESRKAELEAAIDLVHSALSEGGSLFYVGAGTSGRLGVLDASEIPPTFGSPPELVQGIIAGGSQALYQAVEGAEDSVLLGAMAVTDRGVGPRDVVCGIAASGNTPFVLGALRQARELQAKTMFLTCNPARKAEPTPWDVEIDLPTGPELITGSTRLKAGTATKLALNLISTCVMIRLGKVRGNLMIDVCASNDKLRDRAARMLSSIRGQSYDDAWRDLATHGWSVRRCLEEAGE